MSRVGTPNHHLTTLNVFQEDDGIYITVAGAPGLNLTGTAEENHLLVGRLVEEALPRFLASWGGEPAPVPMILHCPICGTQHIDLPDERIGWTNPPHKSHLCLTCGCVWRPADVPTTGVEQLATMGKADTWKAGVSPVGLLRNGLDDGK